MMPSRRWWGCFLLGISMETPMASYTLAIDFYELAFPGLLLAVKLQACYSAAFVTIQLVSHVLDSRLPLSRSGRIGTRHAVVACLLAFTILWERVVIGPGVIHTQVPAAVPLLLVAVTLMGILDGIAMGAVFGEAAVLDPSCAHAVVAGTAAVLPLLSCMRIAFKGALEGTHEGLRLSIILYFATATVVVLIAGTVYMTVVRPAVAEVISGVANTDETAAFAIAEPFSGKSHRSTVLMLSPALGHGHGREGSQADGKGGLQLGYTLNNTFRGTSLLARAVSLGPDAGTGEFGVGSVGVVAKRCCNNCKCASSKLQPPMENIKEALDQDTHIKEAPRQSSSNGPLSAAAAEEGIVQRTSSKTPSLQLHRRLSSLRCDSLVIGRKELDKAVHTGHVADLLKEVLDATAVEESLEPVFFKPGQSVWRSNALLLRNKWPYLLAAMLAPMCTYGIFPSFIDFTPEYPALDTWYSVLIVTVLGWADLFGKLVPVWHPRHPKTAMLAIAFVRVIIFIPIFAIALWLRLGPWAFFTATFMLGVTGGYEATVFALACEDHHPEDAYQIESVLALSIDFGLAFGSIVSLAWEAGPWAAARGM